MELLQSLLVNKKNFRILAFIYIVVVVLVLLWIWWPEKTLEEATYEPYNENAKNTEMIKYYLNFIDSLKRYGTEDVFEEYIDYGYLKYTNTTLSEAIEMLMATDDSYSLGKFDIYKNGDSFVYSVAIPSGDESLNVNIVEKEYPYNFYITYDTFVAYSDLLNYGSIEGAKIKITGTYQNLSYIEYELTMTNEAHEQLVLDFSKASNFKLNMKDGNMVDLNMVQSTQDKLVIDKGQTVLAKLVFNVDIAEQSNISSLSISGISNGISTFKSDISM